MTRARSSTLRDLAHQGVCLRVGPFDVRVQSDLAQVATYVDRFYADFPRSDAEGSHFELGVVSTPGWRRRFRPQANLVVNGQRPFLPLPADVAGGVLEWGLNWCIGNHAHRWLAVHGASVERGGRAMILTAESGAGKSTLCAAMVLDGWRLFSDEFALLDPASGDLQPVPRPLSLKNASIDVIRRRSPPVEFGPTGVDVEGATYVHMRPPADSVRRADERAAPGWIIVPRYVPASATIIEPLDKASALMHVSDQSFNYNYLGQAGFELLVSLVERCDCFTLEYSDLDDALGRLHQLTERTA